MRKSVFMSAAIALVLSSPAFAQDDMAEEDGLQRGQTLEEEAGVAGSGTGADYGAEKPGAAGQGDTLELDTEMTLPQGIMSEGTVDPDTISEGAASQRAAGQRDEPLDQSGQPLEEETGAVDAEGVIPGGMAGGDTSDAGDEALGNQGQGGSAAGGSTGSSQTGGSTGMTGGGGTGGSAGGGSSGGGS